MHYESEVIVPIAGLFLSREVEEMGGETEGINASVKGKERFDVRITCGEPLECASCETHDVMEGQDVAVSQLLEVFCVKRWEGGN